MDKKEAIKEAKKKIEAKKKAANNGKIVKK